MRPITVPLLVIFSNGTLICSLALPVMVHWLLDELLVRVALLEGFWRLFRLAVPLVVRNQVVGALMLDSTHVDFFKQPDLKMVETLGIEDVDNFGDSTGVLGNV